MILQSLKRLGRFELTYSIYLPNHIPNTCLRHIRRVSNLVKKIHYLTLWYGKHPTWIQHKSPHPPILYSIYSRITMNIHIYIDLHVLYICIYIYIFVCSFAVPLTIFGASFASEFTMAVSPSTTSVIARTYLSPKFAMYLCVSCQVHTHTPCCCFFRMQLFINNCITIGMFMSAGKYRNILQYIILCIPRYCLKIYGWLNPHVWFLDAYVAYLVMSTPSRTNSSWSNPSIFVRLLHHCPFLIINSAEVMGLRLVLLSCLFVTLGRQKTFSLYY